MTIKEITKAAKIIQDIQVRKFSHGAEFFRFYKKHNLEFQEFECKPFFIFSDDTLEKIKEKLNDIYNWATYSGGIDVRLEFNKTSFDIFVTVYDGEMLNGARTSMRFKVKFKNLKYTKIIKEFEEAISYKLDDLAEDFYVAELEILKQKRIKEIKKEMLK